MRDSGRGISFKSGSDFSVLRSMKNDHGLEIFFFFLLICSVFFFLEKSCCSFSSSISKKDSIAIFKEISVIVLSSFLILSIDRSISQLIYSFFFSYETVGCK